MDDVQFTRPFYTVRTDTLIGRAVEVKKLEQVLFELAGPPNQTHFFYIAGDGGMGKTRLLEWVSDHYQEILDKKTTFCTKILDFYNSILRTDVDLIEKIADNISDDLDKIGDPTLLKGFEEYKRQRDRFRLRQAGAVGGETGTDVVQAFIDAWTPLAEAGYRLIILLDTAELLRFEDDKIRQRFASREPVSSSKRWLIEMADNDKKLPGVLFVVASRKREAGRLHEEFRSRANHGVADGEQRYIELTGFNQEGVDQYLDELAKVLQEHQYVEEANMIRNELDADLRARLCNVSEGTPITVALGLQLLFEGGPETLVPLFEHISDRSNAQQQFQQALIDALANHDTFGDLAEIVRYMPLMRKGLTPDRFKRLLARYRRSVDDEVIKEQFQRLAKQIFVKVLPDGSLILHDKVADWGSLLHREDDARAVYQELVAVYKEEISHLDDGIKRLIPYADPVSTIDEKRIDDIFASITSGTLDEYDTTINQAQLRSYSELLQIRRERRNRYIELMAYALRGKPVDGYRVYYELAEEAFNVGRMDYEAQIRAEFLGWWGDSLRHQSQAETDGLTTQIVEADLAVRAVQRTYSTDAETSASDTQQTLSSPVVRARETVQLVNKIMNVAKDDKDPFELPEPVRVLLSIYSDMARGHLVASDLEFESVQQSFTDHTTVLDTLIQDKRNGGAKSSSDLYLFLLLSAQAFAYYEWGFFEDNHGNYGAAIKYYTRSLQPYRELGFEINQARSLNDKGYAQAMVGESNNAEMSVSDGLQLRKQLGFSYPIALSHNTLGIVYTMSDRPISGEENCRKALQIFQTLDHEFGQMIAWRALSEALRRDGERPHVDPKYQQLRLCQAVFAAEQAYIRSQQLLDEQDRMRIDILIEFGCAWRDLAKFRWRNPSFPTAGQNLPMIGSDDPELKSRELLIIAADHAATIRGAQTHRVDALINLAYLEFYKIYQDGVDQDRVLEEASKLIDAALAHIPAEFQDIGSTEHQNLANIPHVYWSYLCKVHGLYVRITNHGIRLVRQRRQENEITKEDETLLDHATVALYFRSLIQQDVHNARVTNRVIYESFQTININLLREFGAKAEKIAMKNGLPVGRRDLLKRYLEDSFGI